VVATGAVIESCEDVGIIPSPAFQHLLAGLMGKSLPNRRSESTLPFSRSYIAHDFAAMKAFNNHSDFKKRPA